MYGITRGARNYNGNLRKLTNLHRIFLKYLRKGAIYNRKHMTITPVARQYISIYKSELEQFVFEICLQPIKEQSIQYTEAHPEADFVGTEGISDMKPLSVKDAAIDKDTLAFVLVSECSDSLNRNKKEKISFLCRVTITDKIESVTIVYIQKGEASETSLIEGRVFVDGNLVPDISLETLDTEADAFLAQYYSDALDKPVKVPI